MKRILITGGAGFVGHHVVEHILKNTDWEVLVLDKLTYSSSGFDRLRDIECFGTEEARVRVYTADFTQPISDGLKREIGQVDYIIHMGAESHVDNSIHNPVPFVMSNVLGTVHMLNFAREQSNLLGFVYFSTDEVFGPAPEGTNYREWDRYNSGNPYAASKAGGEEIALAFGNTYKIPVIITHTMNVFGERQHPEKFIPLVIKSVLNGKTVTIHSNKDRNKAGSRFWIHGRNVGAALLFLLEREAKGAETVVDKWNIVGEAEVDNLQMAQLIAKSMGKELKYEMVDFHSSRPGHDLRYALDGGKMASRGWKLPINFEESLDKTVQWTLQHPQWLDLQTNH